MDGRLNTRARVVMAAVLATLPLVALVVHAAWDRYDDDRSQASSRATSRAELYAGLLGQSVARVPTKVDVNAVVELSPLADGTALIVFDASGAPVEQAGPAAAAPPSAAAALAPLLQRGSGTMDAAGADGVQRVWGVAEGDPGSIVYGLPGSSVYGPARSALQRDLWLAGGAVVAAVLAALLIAGRVTAPIRRLAAEAGTTEPEKDDIGAIERGIRRRDQVIQASKLELARRAERLEALNAIDRAILDADTSEAIAHAALSRLRVVTGAMGAMAVTFDAERTRATLLAVATAGPIQVPTGAEFALDAEPFGAELITAGRACRVDVDEVKTSKVMRLLRNAGVQSCVSAPLAAQGELLGAVGLGFLDGDAITDEVLDITTEVAAQLAVALRHARLRAELEAVVAGAFDGIVVIDSRRRVLSANDGACDLFGTPETQLVTKRIDDVVHSEDDSVWADFLRDGTLDGVFTIDVAGRRHEIEVRGRAGFLSGRYLLVLRDVSERQRLEAQLRQAQKLEAIGRLAGGVAHDFNNLLTAISGYSALAKTTVGTGPGSAELDEIDHAAQRAAQLTKQLLTFARQQVLQPVVLDLNDVVKALTPMLTRLIGEDIEIAAVPEAALPSVLADRSQVEQVIVNLVVNARDAMPTGGILTIETRAVTLDEAYTADHAGVEPGDYTCLTVTDTGIGMEDSIQGHIFEPFYTTKDVGRGTGLGLATVHGIVTQSRGHIGVYSEPGLGTTFKIYLPVADVPAAAAAPPGTTTPEPLTGTETVLLCEDDELVRRLLERMLSRRGYTVLTASHPHDALVLATEHERIDVVVTDVVMPQISGPELVERLDAIHPQLRVLFLSGYPIEVIRDRGNLPLGSAFLEKPFNADALARVVRALLDQDLQVSAVPGAGQSTD